MWSVSTRQEEEQPSLFIMLASSHCKFVYRTPLPQTLELVVVFVELQELPTKVIPAIQTQEEDCNWKLRLELQFKQISEDEERLNWQLRQPIEHETHVLLV